MYASGSPHRPRRAPSRTATLVAAGALAAGLLSAGPTATPAAADDRIDPTGRVLLRAEPAAGVRAVDVRLDRRMRPVRNVFRTGRMHTARFRMIGLTWRRGQADLKVRIRSHGRWAPWQVAALLPDGPGPRSAEGRGARRGTQLVWVGAGDAVQVQSQEAPPAGLRMTLIDPIDMGGIGSTGDDTDGGTQQQPAQTDRPDRAPHPKLHRRRQWGADESLRNDAPRYNRTIQQVHIHHTVNSNAYRRGDVPGMIRGMYRYHTQSLGWSDIGYNFLVDKFGRTWIGRAGGAGKPVRGAHTLGFNNTSTGVAVIGNFETGWPGRKAYTALVRLAAWKLDKYKRNPAGKVRVYSHGSDRYPRGARSWLPTIDGHRDTNHTACPGTHLYEKIPNVRRRAAKREARFEP